MLSVRKVLLTGICLVALSLQAEEAPVVSVQRLTYDTAQTIAQAALMECRRQGAQVTVTIVDKNGLVQVVARDTLAPPVSIRISREKAYTAANFSAATSDMKDRASSPIGAVEGVTMSAGGVLIEAAGTIFGAVGVSGAPSGEMDAACAIAGVEAVSDDLEMMD